MISCDLSPLHQRFFLGIDGGGTKTVGLLADGAGHILAKAESSGSNYHAVGEEQTKKRKPAGGGIFSAMRAAATTSRGVRFKPSHAPPMGAGFPHGYPL